MAGTAKAFGEGLGLSKSATHALLSGKSWRDVPRPEGFEEAVREMKAKRKKTDD